MSVMDALYANKASLVAIFNIIDADNSGMVKAILILVNILIISIIFLRRNHTR